jgi:ribonuclease VapC
MVIDSSAIIALLLGEPEAKAIASAIAGDAQRLIAACNALECAVVMEVKKGPSGQRELDLVMHEAGIEIVGMDASQVSLAREAYRRFGKGRHPAGVNLGDCCAYALARQTGEPLLFKGNDFSKTDVRIVQLSSLRGRPPRSAGEPKVPRYQPPVRVRSVPRSFSFRRSRVGSHRLHE